MAYQLPGRLPRNASVAFRVSIRAAKPSAWIKRRTARAFAQLGLIIAEHDDDRRVIAIGDKLRLAAAIASSLSATIKSAS